MTLKHLLQRKQSPLTPARVLALLATVQSADIVLPTTDGRETDPDFTLIAVRARH